MAAAEAGPSSLSADGVLPSPSITQALDERITTITADSTCLLKLPSGTLKSVKLQRGSTISLGKFGSFKADDIIGQPYGFTYEIDGTEKLKVVLNSTLSDIEETDANNENIIDNGASQKLTFVDIAALKEKGLSGRDIIMQAVEGSTTYQLRTDYSKDKYVKRKEAKHMKLFTPLAPTCHTLCDYNFKKHAEKVREIRPDALAYMLALVNARPGGRYICVDGAGGLVVASMLERMGGSGTLLTINDTDSPPAFDLVSQFNFPAQQIDGVLKSNLTWAAVQPDWELPEPPTTETSTTRPGNKPLQEREKARIRRRKAAYDETRAQREELFAGNFDGLIVASQYEPYSVVESLRRFMGGSASIVVHNPYPQLLTEAQAKMRAQPYFLSPSVHEPWTRRYQVLPGRTHPEVTMSASAGCVLHTYVVIPDDTASSFKASRSGAQAKRRRLEAQAKSASASPVPESRAEGEKGDAPAQDGSVDSGAGG